MSDDTPTERFDSAHDTPTQRLDAPAPAAEGEGERKSRRLIVILSVIGGLLLIAVLIVLILLLTRGSGTPATPTASPSVSASASSSPTPTKSATPSATPTPTPTPTKTVTPPDTTTSVTSFQMSKSHNCSQGTPVYLKVSWESNNGVTAYFGVNTNDAQSGGMGWKLPPSGNQDDFPEGYVPYEYQCGNTSTDYTITVVGSDGTKASKKFTVNAEN